MFEWLFPSSSGAIKFGIDSGSGGSFFGSLEKFFQKIKDLLNTVLWGKVTVTLDKSGWIPKTETKDTRFYLWQLLLIAFIVWVVSFIVSRSTSIFKIFKR
jgi:hypothetical protein